MKHFTVAEAEALIPQIEKIFEAVAELAAQAELKAGVLRKAEKDEETAAAAIARSQLQFLAQRINERMQSIVDLGALPKGIAPALADFLSRLDGEDVYLCWRLGEKRITHYHPINEGFSGRKALPRR